MAAVVVERFFVNILNLSQLTKPIQFQPIIDPEKANEVLDTNIFELLPAQPTRQNRIDRFFVDFNDLIGPKPGFIDVDNDGAGEQPINYDQDEEMRISTDNPLPTAFITRLNSQAIGDSNNQGKTLESMRNKLNTYLGDVDNVIEDMEDQRPEYENKSEGFLKIRKPNQAIILRAPDNGKLEFQKEVDGQVYISRLGLTEVTGPSYLVDGFTITMWVRFLSKTSEGTLFNYGNPLYDGGRGGFRLDTKVNTHNEKTYRYFRLSVYDNIEEINEIEDGDSEYRETLVRDNHWGYDGYGPNLGRVNQRTIGNQTDTIHNAFPKVPTDNLDEWYFICATYNPKVQEKIYDNTVTAEDPPVYNVPDNFYDRYSAQFTDKQYWLNHLLPAGTNTDYTLTQQFSIGTLLNPLELFIETSYNDIPLPIHGDISSTGENTVIRVSDEDGNIYTSEVVGKNGNENDGYTIQGYFVGGEGATQQEREDLFNERYGLGGTPLITIGIDYDPPPPSILTTAIDNNIITEDLVVAESGQGAKCKVEIISRSDLLHARGHKLPEDDLIVEAYESYVTPDTDDDDWPDELVDAGDPPIEQDDTTFTG